MSGKSFNGLVLGLMQGYLRSQPASVFETQGFNKETLLAEFDKACSEALIEEPAPLWRVLEYRLDPEKNVLGGYPKNIVTVAHEDIAIDFARELNKAYGVSRDPRCFFDVVPCVSEEDNEGEEDEVVKAPEEPSVIVSASLMS